jgi:hypothetical protein
MLSKKFLSVLTASVIAASATAQVTISAGTATFFDISTTGTALTGAGDDSSHGFTSTIGNELLPAGPIVVNSNGHVIAGATPGSSFYFNSAITAASDATQFGYTAGLRVVCPWWDDLYASALPNATIYWQEVGGVLYIQWNLIGHFATFGGPAGPAITFQIQVVPANCAPSAIHMVYPDATFGGAQAANDLGASATVGYIGATTTDNAQFSFDTPGSIPDGTSLTILATTIPFSDSWSSPMGVGSIQYNVCAGSPLGTYQLLATVNQGAFPNGWLYGIDITYPELLSELGAPPFLGLLDGSGAAQIGPLAGLPSGLTIYALTFNIPPGSVPTVHTNAEAYTVP